MGEVPHVENGELPLEKPTLSTFSLEGRVCVVTGGAQGLGLVMSRALVMSGASVALIDLQKETATREAENLVFDFKMKYSDAKHVPKVTAHYSDVSNEEWVDIAINEVLEAHGKIDHLVTSAGFTENIPALEYPIDHMRRLFDVNVLGTYLFAVAVAKHLIARKAPGSMVLIGSMSGAIVNLPQRQTPYNASKAAVRHMAASLAVEWAQYGIRVNCISPGYMTTPLTKEIMEKDPAIYQQWVAGVPQGKMGQPTDLAGPVTFLLSDAAGYITGADLRVDGGFTVL